MFNQNNEEEKKLDWMYKGPNSNVSREEYLLGRPVDKTLEQINEEDKLKQQGLIAVPKNRVEHECIPPSIRDFNKLVQAEQVDLSTKLQEDPLVAIKKREEETRREFLQNPVQLKKLQKALKAQQAKKKKKKKKSKKASDSDSDLESKLTEKILGKKASKLSRDEKNLDIILIHKYEALKDKLTESDLQDILNGKFTDSDDSSSEDEKPKKKSKKKRNHSSDESEDDIKNRNHKNIRRKEDSGNRRNYQPSRDDFRNRQRSRERKPANEDRYKRRSKSPSSSSSEDERAAKRNHSRKYDSDDSDSAKPKKLLYGLVSSDGKRIPLQKKYNRDEEETKSAAPKVSKPAPPVQKHKSKRLTEEEKEKLRQEMMYNAIERDRERARNLRQYRKEEEKEQNQQDFDSNFAHKQLLKSANTSSVESRIKSNLNKIQRSSRDMDKNFSRR